MAREIKGSASAGRLLVQAEFTDADHGLERLGMPLTPRLAKSFHGRDQERLGCRWAGRPA